MTTDRDHPDFDGKTVAFYGPDLKALGTLVSPRFEEQVGRWFVVGGAATSAGNWAEGALAAIAWDEVCAYVALDTDLWVSRRARRNRKEGSSWSLWGRK